MARTHKPERQAGILLMLVLAVALSSLFVWGDPTGSSITNPSTDTGPSISPASRADSKGTITTMSLSSVQQTVYWKGYVGNVSGSFTLDDSDDFTLYSWDFEGSITGEVYVSTNDTLDWTSVSCASRTQFITSDSNLNILPSMAHNETFNVSVHDQLIVGVTTIPQNTCNTTNLYQDDSPVVPAASANWQLIPLTDNTGRDIIYAAPVFSDQNGYNRNQTDFQVIVPDNETATLTYYFYVELG